VSTILTVKVLQEAAREWLGGQTEDFYFSGSNSLLEKCCKCVELSGDYIENSLLEKCCKCVELSGDYIEK